MKRTELLVSNFDLGSDVADPATEKSNIVRNVIIVLVLITIIIAFIAFSRYSQKKEEN